MLVRTPFLIQTITVGTRVTETQKRRKKNTRNFVMFAPYAQQRRVKPKFFLRRWQHRRRC